MATIHDGELATPPDASGYIDDLGPLPKSEIKQATFVVFNSYVNDTGGSAFFVSNLLLNGVLGAFDQLAVQVVTDRLSSSGIVTLSARVSHSGDGRQWEFKATSPEVPVTTLSKTGTTTLQPGYDDGSIPTMAFARIYFTYSATAAFTMRVKCTVTANNKNERAFTRSVMQYVANDELGGCVSWMNSGTVITRAYVPGQGWGDGRLRRAAETSTLAHEGGVGGKGFDASLSPYFRVVSETKEGQLVRLRDGYRICFRKDESLAVLKGATIVFMTTRYHEPKKSLTNHSVVTTTAKALWKLVWPF